MNSFPLFAVGLRIFRPYRLAGESLLSSVHFRAAMISRSKEKRFQTCYTLSGSNFLNMRIFHLSFSLITVKEESVGQTKQACDDHLDILLTK